MLETIFIAIISSAIYDVIKRLIIISKNKIHQSFSKHSKIFKLTILNSIISIIFMAGIVYMYIININNTKIVNVLLILGFLFDITQLCYTSLLQKYNHIRRKSYSKNSKHNI